ncbi:MAG TPA: helix-turn-helix transcriptional regulator [Bacillota bacterium]|nr:helix-turn-helix transcriptional regulator [Fastidiosipila sp.]HPX92590.1 helix-turn-helix transcriptional regulator [Bacillota bacterium]HQB81142.1 helix-turn-helix transcriptional regulator [Bacillota bacterium]
MLQKMGSFLAALRKTKGLSQMELAELLNVSDKTVSRWERGKGSPDLTLIPLLADLFGVTSDEIIRGERIPAAPEKLEDLRKQEKITRKQTRRLLNLLESRFKNRSLLAAGTMLTGLLVSMICNFGFHRALLGFFLAIFFYLAGIFLGVFFFNTARAGSVDEAFDSKERHAFIRSVFTRTKRVIYLAIILLAATLPLTLAGDPYLGLVAGYWFPRALLAGGLALILLFIIDPFVTHLFIRRKLFLLDPGELQVYKSNYRIKKRLVLALCLVFLLTFAAQNFFNANWDASRLVTGSSFADFESFKAWMEQETTDQFLWKEKGRAGGFWLTNHEEDYDGEGNRDPEFEYLDPEGKPLTKEEALLEHLYDHDGRLVGSYVARNRDLALIKFGGEEIFPLRVYTHEDLARGDRVLDLINIGFILVYLAEATILLAVYYKKRPLLP